MAFSTIVLSASTGALAAFAACCPRGDPDCPHRRGLFCFVFGAIAGAGYTLLLGRKSLESVDLIALIFVVYLLTYFISSFLPGRKKT